MTDATTKSNDFAFGLNCSPPVDHVGGWVSGSLSAPRQVVQAEALYRAFHELDDRIDPDQEAFATIYQYPKIDYTQYVCRHGTPKGYAGPAACCRLTWDIDRENDLERALIDVRTLAKFLMSRYGLHAENGLGAYFSGSKGFHLTMLAMPGFHPFPHVPAVVKLLCGSLARSAGVAIDSSVYDTQRLFRLPNSRHGKTGRYKRFLEFEELFRLDADRIRKLAEHPNGCSVPSVVEDCPPLAEDWAEAERIVLAGGREGVSGSFRPAPANCPVVPKFVRDFIGFGDIQDPGRAVTLFRCAAALAEAGTPDQVVRGLLEESALKSNLDAHEVAKQIADGIAHGRKAKRCPT